MYLVQSFQLCHYELIDDNLKSRVQLTLEVRMKKDARTEYVKTPRPNVRTEIKLSFHCCFFVISLIIKRL